MIFAGAVVWSLNTNYFAEKEELDKKLALEREAKCKEDEERDSKLAEIERKKLEREKEIEEKLHKQEQEERDFRMRGASEPQGAKPESRDPWRRRPEPKEQEDPWRRGGPSNAPPASREMDREQPPPRGMHDFVLICFITVASKIDYFGFN